MVWNSWIFTINYINLKHIIISKFLKKIEGGSVYKLKLLNIVKKPQKLSTLRVSAGHGRKVAEDRTPKANLSVK